MTPRYKSKKVVVTGGSRGIGQAIAMAFAEQGADVVITYNSDFEAAEVVVNEIQKFGSKAKAIKMDLQNNEDRCRLVKESYEFFDGDIDVLVNNAGILTRRPFIELSKEEIIKVLEINLLAPLFLMQEFAKHMVRQQESLLEQSKALKDYCIINITSISKKVITHGLSHYETSKAALSQLTRSVSVDLARYNIRVNDVAPGLIPTDINRNQWQANSSIWQKRVAGIPLHRSGTSKEVAQAVLSVVDNAWMTGTTVTVDGGRTRNWSGTEINENSRQSVIELSKPKL
ncbi:MAG: SDR family oxidoreductase [Gammaproteobacteria bacterium]|nr:SDR family oxidoreductase [Gammaproteobacteria bacterium]MCW5583041.1 SDR family oxidoreductase [Gammaproteobacteria bacterium]